MSLVAAAEYQLIPQSLATLFVAALFWVIYGGILGQRSRCLWWAWAWTLLAVEFMSASVAHLRAPLPAPLGQTLEFLPGIAGFAAMPFVVLGARACLGAPPRRPERWKIWVLLALCAALALDAISFLPRFGHGAAHSLVRSAPRQGAMGVALLWCGYILLRSGARSGSRALRLSAACWAAWGLCKITYAAIGLNTIAYTALAFPILAVTYTPDLRVVLTLLDFVFQLLLALSMIVMLMARHSRTESELGRLKESVRHSETMAALGAVVAAVAHEVRSPLFSMTATLDAFEARFGVRRQTRRHVENLRKQLDRLTRLMQDLLEYGKPPKVDTTSESLAHVFELAADNTGALAARANVRIERHVVPGLPRFSVDRDRFVQVFGNLLENAINFSPAGGVVTLRAGLAYADGGFWVECTVRDRGPGFAPEDLARVFDPFFTRRRDGTGLGLPLARRIVEEYGGTVTAHNHPSGGAEILVRLPIARADQQRAG